METKLKKLDKTYTFKFNLKGRVQNYTLAPTKCFLPLYEAVVNSIQSIRNSKVKNGEIVISLIRREEQQSISEEITNKELIGFSIKDNGEGFNEVNMDSFITPDISTKESCRGIGRFSWLKAFHEVKVKSNYLEPTDKKYYYREFDFSFKNNPIQCSAYEESNNKKNITTVSLLNYKNDYLIKANEKSIKVIADSLASDIIHHCLDFLLDFSTCPQITVEDQSNDKTICLNDIFKENYKKLPPLNFQVKDKSFVLNLFKVYNPQDPISNIYFSSQGIIIEDEKYNVKELLYTSRFNDDMGSFALTGYIKSELFDEYSNESRTAIDIPKHKKNIGLISKEEIIECAVEKISKEIPAVRKAQEEKLDRVINYIEQEAPEYRFLLKETELLNKAPLEKLDEYLLDSSHQLSVGNKKHIKELKKERTLALTDNNKEELVKIDKEIANALVLNNELNHYELSKYVLRRKDILDLLEEYISRREDNSFELEESVHNLIFPKSTTSNELPYDSQNLWIVDEKLNYHTYLQSDRGLGDLKKKDTPKMPGDRKKPDILIFDNVILFSDKPNDDLNIESITLIEFKRPGAKKEKKSPIDQIIEYIKLLKNKKITGANGRIITVQEHTKFFAYIISELNPDMMDAINKSRLRTSNDGHGYYGPIEAYNLWVEVIDFEKLLKDAKKRNRVFFDKLGIK